jgi:arylsulfatase A-like enzyme
MGSLVRAQLVTLSALIAALLLSCQAPSSPGPSLLLVTASSVAVGALPCYGGSGDAGQAICGLAERGARFVWAFSTHPETAPAAATLLTAQPSEIHGVTPSAATFLPTGTPTLASELRRAGYDTAAFVAVAELNRSRNLQLGFDRYEVTADRVAAEGAHRASDAFSAWLAQRQDTGRPWFAWVHYPSVGLPPKRGFSLRALDQEFSSVVEAARAETREGGLGIAFSALRGSSSAHPLALSRVRVPLLWAPPNGVVAQRLVAPVSLLDLGPTWFQAAQLQRPPPSAGEPLRVEPLPPAAAQPARPLFLAGGGEVGLVLSRRFYARPQEGRTARTALLSNDGTTPTPFTVSVDAAIARPLEALLPREVILPASAMGP